MWNMWKEPHVKDICLKSFREQHFNKYIKNSKSSDSDANFASILTGLCGTQLLFTNFLLYPLFVVLFDVCKLSVF